MSEAVNIVGTDLWVPQMGPQQLAIETAYCVDELLYGGARGGGKTAFLLGDFLMDVSLGQAWQGVLFRRSYPELDEVVRLALEMYPITGAEYKVGVHEWRWPNGATLRLRHIENLADVAKYQGMSYQWIGWDELANWPSLDAYHALKATLRGGGPGQRIRATANPGGPGHAAVKEYFIAPNPKGYEEIEGAGGMTRMFIPSLVTDNKILLARDPGYIDRLEAVGDPELVRAWKEGDWDAILGGYFGMFRPQNHLVEPFEIPEGWAVFSCGDYGETNPCWWGLIAVDYDDDVWVIDEYYRAGVGGADHARAVKAMITECPFLPGSRPRLNLAPTDMWTKRAPGEASQALAPKDSFANAGVYLTKANMARVNGWRNLKDLMYAGRLKFFRDRTDRIISSLSTVQRDPHDAEDVLKGGDDHPADGLRYGINHVYKPRKLAEPLPTEVGTGNHLLMAIEALGKKNARYG